MKVRGLARHLPIAIAVLLLALLAELAALQWRWIGEVNAMERQRMLASLAGAGGRFTEDFDREVTRVFLYFHPEMSEHEESPERVLQQYDRWQAEAAYPNLVREVFLVRRGDDGRPELRVLRAAERRFAPCPWPPELVRLGRHLHEGFRRPASHFGFRGMTPAIFGELPGMLIPLSFHVPEAHPDAGGLEGAHLLIWFDLRTISEEIFPALTRRYFGDPRGGDYALAVVDPAASGKAVFLSDPRVPASTFGADDLRLGMLRLRPFEELHSLRTRHGARGHRWRRPAEPRPRMGPPPLAGRSPESGEWRLILKHRDGSLEAAVAAIRRRNLGISFGILALLGAAVAMLMVTTQRAQRLARQQIEFVAGVTHELNTPLTAIRSAGQNLADGVVAEPSQVRRYGSLIESEGRRLSNMVGQALELAGIQSGRRAYHSQPVEVAEVLDGALQDCRWLLQEKGVEVERDVEPGLPPVLADVAALRRAVQNLLENAVKYGGGAGWIGLRARRAPSGQVEITVADRGPGIRREDLPHLFEPFYRGRDAAAGGVPGSGLGLSLVRHVAEAHGGRITVETGEGSAFTLHLPAAAEPEEMQAVEEPA
jgi:signal transduction histidine kinase